MDVSNIARMIRTSNAVAELGAGALFDAGMPLAGELRPLLWGVLDESRSVKAQVSAELGLPESSGKILVEADHNLQIIWKHVSADSLARQVFQEKFCALNSARAQLPSPSHTAIARIIYLREAML